MECCHNVSWDLIVLLRGRRKNDLLSFSWSNKNSGYPWPNPVSELVLTFLSSVSLTGLLSFMLSDEMTTGSVTSTVAHKRAFATRSHSWNIAQTRFKDAFPEVS